MICDQCKVRAEKDPQTGTIVCPQCGRELDDSRIVSDVTFSETASGKAVVTGQYVSNDQAGVIGNSVYGLQAGESRRQTIEKARIRMERIGRKILIPEHIIEGGLRFFRAALANNFVKGRKSQHVLSACLYLSCRLGNTDHMLMDFAEVLRVNVFNIGATYLQLLRKQSIEKLPVVDPTVFIHRFVAKLNFGVPGSRKVVKDAKLLVQRMGKDWLQQGRRPAGVAAACILLAARMNNFRRSKLEIVQVAKIAEETLQRRLNEFKNTPAGTLTVSDFRDTNVDSAADPPSFTRHRELEKLYAEKKAREEELENQGMDTRDIYLDKELEAIARELDKDDGETMQLSADVEAVLMIPELKEAYAELDKEDERLRKIKEKEAEEEAAREEAKSGKRVHMRAALEGPSGEGEDDDEEEASQEAITAEEEEAIERKFLEGGGNLKTEGTEADGEEASDDEEGKEEDDDEGEGEDDDENDSSNDIKINPPAKEESIAPEEATHPTIKLSDAEGGFSSREATPEVKQSQDSESFGSPTPRRTGPGRAEQFLIEFRKKRLARLALEAEAAEEEKQRREVEKQVAEELMSENLSDVDDDEIESVLLTEDEIEIKTRVWMSINREYLIDQERKRLRAEHDKANGVSKPPRKRKKPSERKPGQNHGAATAADAAANMVREKAHSKKINYQALGSLFVKK